MNPFSPRWILWIGFGLVLAGAVLPLLMVLRVLPASLGLSFVSYIASVSGLFLGLIGVANYIRERGNLR